MLNKSKQLPNSSPGTAFPPESSESDLCSLDGHLSFLDATALSPMFGGKDHIGRVFLPFAQVIIPDKCERKKPFKRLFLSMLKCLFIE